MSRAKRFCAACAAATLVLALSAAATAAAKKPAAITGKLSQPGYTVIALATNGKATSVRVKSRSFKLRPPAKLVTLHLRAPNGTYGGPFVVGRKGKRAILGVKAGARLGKVTVRRGYAKPKRKLSKRFLGSKRQARAKQGVPIGVGKTGLVQTKLPRRGGPGDRDLDGVPNVIDIDDDGDLILDGYDRTGQKTKALKAKDVSQAAGGPHFPDGTNLNIGAQLVLATPDQVVNVNGGSSDAQIAIAEQNKGTLELRWVGADAGSGELDCGTLIYCSRNSTGGTGRWEPGIMGRPKTNDLRASAPLFPDSVDSDHDGWGTLNQTQYGGGPSPIGGGAAGGMTLYHGATVDQIHASDVLIEHAEFQGAPVQYASSVGYIFSTFPVVAGYDDGQGNSATFSYPRVATGGSCPVDVSPRPPICPRLVRAGPNGDVVLTLKFWRPQRLRTAGDPGTGRWMDVGNLGYAVGLALQSEGPVQTSGPNGTCKQGSYVGIDPALTPLPFALFPEPISVKDALFGDTSGDRPQDPSSTFTNTLNVSNCAASIGASLQSMPNFAIVIHSYAIDSDPEIGETPTAFSSAFFQRQP